LEILEVKRIGTLGHQSEIGEIQFIQDVTGKVAGLDPPLVS